MADSIWRVEKLTISTSGTPGNYITIAGYNSPILYYSYNKSSSSNWTNEGGNIWSHTPDGTLGSEQLTNPSFETDLTGWNVYTAGGASCTFSQATSTGEYDSGSAGAKISCSNNGGASGDVILRPTLGQQQLSVTAGKVYKLSFRSKATTTFTTGQIILGAASNYKSDSSLENHIINTSWKTYTTYFIASTTATNARFGIYVGNAIPEGGTWYIDTFSFKEAEYNTDVILDEVGNIVANASSINPTVLGPRVWTSADLDTQGEWWWDWDNNAVKVYSTSNPASYYSDIEVVLDPSGSMIYVAANTSYIKIQNLTLKYGGFSGIDLANGTNYIEITNNNVSYQGGAEGINRSEVIAGNCIQAWDGNTYIYVRYNWVSQCYDTGLTTQGGTAGTIKDNQYWEYNIVSESPMGFEIFQNNNGTMSNISIANNVFYKSGSWGWGYSQRPAGTGQGKGSGLINFGMIGIESNISFKNNIISEWSNQAINWISASDVNTISLNYNDYYDSDGSNFSVKGGAATYTTFTDHQTGTGHDANSINQDPVFVNTSGLFNTAADFHLQPSSPAINAGINVGLTLDYNGISIPQGPAPDIGAFEYADATAPSVPTNLSATAISTSQINLSWATSTDDVKISGYKIYRNGAEIIATTSNSYQDKNLSSGTNYTYTVSSYDVFNNESQQSNSVSAITEKVQEEVSSPSSGGGGGGGGIISGGGGASAPSVSEQTATTTATTTSSFGAATTTVATATTTERATAEGTATSAEAESVAGVKSIEKTKTKSGIFIQSTLKFGIKNDEVKKLQEFLAGDPEGQAYGAGSEIYPEGLITGYYGLLTQKAVQKFQCKHNIVCEGSPQTTGYGMVGPKTRLKLNELYSGQNTKSPDTISLRESYGAGKTQITNNEEEIKQIESQIKQLRIQMIQLLNQLIEAIQKKLEGVKR